MAPDSNGTYPQMVIEVDQMAQWQRTGAPPSPLGTRVSAALRDVLAWRARADDAKGFAAALDRAFTPEIENGYTRWLWTPRSYAIQADLGEVTGAQASLYSRGKAAIDHAIPLLEGLHKLNPAADEDDADAVRSLIIDELRELVAEFGAVGGPRVPRVNGLFMTLVGSTTTNPRVPGEESLLKLLGVELGLGKDRVNTIEDEQNLTNYYIVVDHVIALRSSWESFAASFASDPFFGTQLILLSRALASIVEAVTQAVFVLDSVFLSAADRQLIRIPSADGTQSLSVTQLLSWIERFAAEEAPRIMREAGKRGVGAFEGTLNTLIAYVHQAYTTADGGIPDAFRLERVTNSLEELELYLKKARDLATQVKNTKEPASADYWQSRPVRSGEAAAFETREDPANRAVRVELRRR